MFDLEPVLAYLESTHMRIDPRFSVTYSVFWRFWERTRAFGEQLFSGIDRAHQVCPGTIADELGIDTWANRSEVFSNL